MQLLLYTTLCLPCCCSQTSCHGLCGHDGNMNDKPMWTQVQASRPFEPLEV